MHRHVAVSGFHALLHVAEPVLLVRTPVVGLGGAEECGVAREREVDGDDVLGEAVAELPGDQVDSRIVAMLTRLTLRLTNDPELPGTAR